ncbi:MAG: hemolysin III family protein [Erysipelotrichaceae bacterium]|nr:hemolysin III family protein [Erysipelotrichaceae bacterium]
MINKLSQKEEIFNSITHGIGVGFGFFALIMLLIPAVKTYDIGRIVSFSIYGICIIAMFLSSTVYHGISNEKTKSIVRVFDHSSIFLFIAGTYTPIIMLKLTGSLKLILLIGIWSIALIGVIFKIFTYGKFDKYKAISLILYIGMGWIAIFPIKAIINATSIDFFIWILGGGVLYTLGTIFYGFKKIPFNHGIWHLFVLAASVVHFIGIYLYLV